MIVELLKYLVNPAPAYVKKMGYLKESIAIEARYNRNKSAWESHLNNSKNFIVETSQKLLNRRTVVVLGSGSLYDVPLTFLSNSFNEVILVDIYHLRSTKRKIRKFPNVKLCEKDITGISSKIYDNYLNKNFIFPSPRHDFSFIKKDVDLVVSLNLLPQLPLMPQKFIQLNFDKFEQEVNNYCRSIIESHLDFLKRISCEICLISEIERSFISKENKFIEKRDALYGFQLPTSKVSWNWDIAPLGEFSSDYSIMNKISGYNKADFQRF